MIQSVLQPVEFLAAVTNVATILGALGMPALVLFFVAFGCESGGAIWAFVRLLAWMQMLMSSQILDPFESFIARFLLRLGMRSVGYGVQVKHLHEALVLVAKKPQKLFEYYFKKLTFQFEDKRHPRILCIFSAFFLINRVFYNKFWRSHILYYIFLWFVRWSFIDL